MESALLQRQSQKDPWFYKLDIFSFLPVPRTKPLTTKTSLIGSLSFFFVIFCYLTTQFVMFLTKNTPKIIQTTQPLNNNLVIPYQANQQPFLSFAFQNGTELQESYMDKSYFSISIEHIVQNSTNKEYKKVDYHPCTKKEQAYTNMDLQLYCPSQDVFMQGVLGNSDTYQYFRLVMKGCDVKEHDYCQKMDEQKDFWGKGRFFVYVYKYGETDYRTKEQQKDSVQIFQYFIVQNFYNREEVVVQVRDTSIYPNDFTTFSVEEKSDFSIKSTNFFVSQVNDNHLFTIWFRLDPDINKVDVVYQTLIDCISQWGAMCSVLFTCFAIFFIKHNSDQFYSQNQNWQNFDQELVKLRDLNEKQNEMITLQRKRIQRLNDTIKDSQDNSINQSPSFKLETHI